MAARTTFTRAAWLGLAVAGLSAPTGATEPPAVTGHDPVLGVITTAGEGAEARRESAQLPPGGSNVALTGLGLAAGGGLTVGAVAATGSGDSGSSSSSGSDSGGGGDSTEPPSNDGSDPGDADGDGGANETPDDGSFDEPDQEDPGSGPDTGSFAETRQRSVSFAGGGRLTVASRGARTTWYLSQPLGSGAYATLAGGLDPHRTGGFYGASPVAADLLPAPAALGSGGLQGLGRLQGGNARLAAGPGTVRLGAFAGSGGTAAVSGYRLAGPAGRIASTLALQNRPSGGVLHAGTRLAASLPGGGEVLAGTAARSGATALAGRAVAGLAAAPPGTAARLGLVAARTWHTGMEGGMSATGNNSGYTGNPQRQASKVSVQAFAELGLGARTELGLGTRWAPNRGNRNAARDFVAKLTAEF